MKFHDDTQLKNKQIIKIKSILKTPDEIKIQERIKQSILDGQQKTL